MLTLAEYMDVAGRSPFGRWFEGLDAQAAAKVAATLYRLEAGNESEVRSVGGGVYERRIHSGPGYRIYFAHHGQQLILLLGGGTKGTQAADISRAKARRDDFKQRRRR